MKRYLIIAVALVVLVLAACHQIEQNEGSTVPTTQTTAPTTKPTETTAPTTQPTETTVPTEPQMAKPDSHGWLFVFDGSNNPSFQNDADVSECVEGCLYWYNAEDKHIFCVTDEKLAINADNSYIISASDTNIFYVTEDEPTKIYATPLDDLSKHEVIYESEHGNIGTVLAGDFQYENTVLHITEGGTRYVYLDLIEMKAELIMEQYLLLYAVVETMDNIARDENGEQYLVDCNKIFFVGKLSAEDTEVKSYHYYRDTGEVVEFKYK